MIAWLPMPDAEKRSPALWAGLILALGLAFNHRLLTGPGIVYSPHSDIVAYLAGAKSVFQAALKEEGGLPLWNPAANCGTPAHARPASMYTFPLHWPYLFLSVEKATNLAVLLDLLLAGLAMYLLCLRLLQRPESAFFCGAGYMLCLRALHLVHAGWFGGLTMYALTPLWFWALDRILEAPDGRRTAALAAVGWLCLIQGYIQGFYYVCLCSLVFISLRLRPLAARQRLARLAALAAASVLACLLAAPDLLPQMEFVSLSTRTVSDYAFFIRGAPSWTDLRTLFDPLGTGGRPEFWESNFYFGLWLYPPALFACWKRPRQSLPLLLGAAALVLFSFDTPLTKLGWTALPGFKLFRTPSRMLPLAQLLLLLLAGKGLDAAWPYLPARPWRTWLFAALGLLPLCDGALSWAPRTMPLSEIFPDLPLYAPLKRDRLDGRVAAFGRHAIPYGAAGVLGMDMANGYEPLNLRHFEEYFSILKHGDARKALAKPVVWTDFEAVAKPDMLRALDVRYIAANAPQPLEQLGFAPAGEARDVPVFDFYRGMIRATVRLWRDTRPLGPAYFATRVARVEDEAASRAAVSSARSVREAYVFGLDAQPPALRGGAARMTHRGYGRYLYDLDSRGENFLILSQVWYPGWRARLDGRELRLYRTNHALLGCFVPPGRHELSLEMTSPQLRLGLLLFVLGGAALAILISWPRDRDPA
jgi:hypothetical protein